MCKYLLSVIVIFFGITGCQDISSSLLDSSLIDKGANDYLPLTVGNYWVYSYSGYATTNREANDTVKLSVASSRIDSGKNQEFTIKILSYGKNQTSEMILTRTNHEYIYKSGSEYFVLPDQRTGTSATIETYSSPTRATYVKSIGMVNWSITASGGRFTSIHAEMKLLQYRIQS